MLSLPQACRQDSADAVLMNPPFNDPARHRASPNKSREIAHVATEDTLQTWIHAARGGCSNPAAC